MYDHTGAFTIPLTQLPHIHLLFFLLFQYQPYWLPKDQAQQLHKRRRLICPKFVFYLLYQDQDGAKANNNFHINLFLFLL